MKKREKSQKYIYKPLFWCCFAICAALCAVTVALLIRGNYFTILRQAMTQESYRYTDNASYTQRASQFEMLPDRKADVAFLGDSITARFEWQEYFAGLTVSNRGIDSDVCEGVYHRLDTVINQNPDKLFVMIGINDIRQQIDPDVTMGFYAAMIDRLQSELPECQIYLQSVLPVNFSTGIDNAQVQSLNARIKELADASSLTYIDLYSELVTDDNNFLLTADGVHPTGEGYRIWMDVIEPFVYE